MSLFFCRSDVVHAKWLEQLRVVEARRDKKDSDQDTKRRKKGSSSSIRKGGLQTSDKSSSSIVGGGGDGSSDQKQSSGDSVAAEGEEGEVGVEGSDISSEITAAAVFKKEGEPEAGREGGGSLDGDGGGGVEGAGGGDGSSSTDEKALGEGGDPDGEGEPGTASSDPAAAGGGRKAREFSSTFIFLAKMVCFFSWSVVCLPVCFSCFCVRFLFFRSLVRVRLIVLCGLRLLFGSPSWSTVASAIIGAGQDGTKG